MYNTGRGYNAGERYNMLPIPWQAPAWFTHVGHALPVVVDGQLRPVALLSKAHDIFLHETLAGEDRLTFVLPHPVPEEFVVDATLDLAGKIYRAMILNHREYAEGHRYVEVEAWALWYDLSKLPTLPAQEWVNVLASDILAWLLPGSGWTVGTVSVTARRSLRWSGGSNRLECLRELERTFNAEIVWDTVRRTVSVVAAGGADTGVFFLRGKNLRTAESEISIVETVHRLYPRGHRGLTIALVNGGVPYLEVPSPHNPPPSAVLLAESFTDPHQLKEYAEAVFATLNTPQTSYICGIVDLSMLPGYEEDRVRVGDVVTVHDETAGISIKTRVVRMRYSVEKPWESDIELSTVRADLSQALSQVARALDVFEAEESVQARDIAQLMVFNHLLNSRADDGFAYWVNDGWTVDNTQGFSGPASFRAVGALGVSKTLTQTVWPAHRENYVVSLRAQTENILLGGGGKVGIEVVLHYTDGTSETHFISLV